MPPSRSFTTRSSHSTAPSTSGDEERDAETLNSTRECPDKNLLGRYAFTRRLTPGLRQLRDPYSDDEADNDEDG
ncbi:hypothetical protein ACIRVK_41140 [Streptomyces sp. NPDC101152]|uniref:hypothetical protein n=1 Tax=Streptomyces sp. NPDC101152 TaxID=3366116 RepID=UPI0038305626